MRPIHARLFFGLTKQSAGTDALGDREGIEHHHGSRAEEAPGRPIGRDEFPGGGLRAGAVDFNDGLFNRQGFHAEQAAVSPDRQKEGSPHGTRTRIDKLFWS